MNRRERRRIAKLAANGPSNVVPIKSAEIGTSGTLNWSGQIHAEANSKLQWEKAYGSPGSTTWGEWEKLERTDHQVASALNLVAAPLRDSIVEVEPGSDDSEDVAIADFVRDNLEKWLEPRAPQLIEQQIRYGLAYGFHLGELVWATRADKRVPGGVAVYLKKLAQRLPSSVAPDGWKEKDGELDHIRQQGFRDGKWMDVALPADKVLLCTWNKTGNNYLGFSAFRPIWYLAQMRADLLRIIAIGHQRESLGVPVVETDLNTPLDKSQRDELQLMLEDLVYHENAGMQLPPGAKIQWFFSPGANKGHVLETWKALGLAILEVVQAQQSYLGTSDTGSRAVGEVHAAAQNSFVRGVRAWLEACWNGIGGQPYTGVIRKLVDANFGQRESYPTFRLVTKAPEMAPNEFASAIATLVQASAIRLTDDDENDIRERIGLRPIDAEQRAALVPAVPPTEEGPPEVAKSAPETSGEGGDVASPAPSEAASLSRQGVLRLGFTPYRPLREEELVCDLAAMDGFLDGTTDATEEALTEAVTATMRSLLPVIERAMADGNPSELRNLEVPDDKIAAVAQDASEKAAAFGYAQAEKERQRGSAKVEDARQDGKPGIKGEPTKLADKRKAIKRDKALEAHVHAMSERVVAKMRSQTFSEAVRAAQRGDSARKALEAALEAYAKNRRAMRYESSGIVNTSFGLGRSKYLEDNKDDVESVMYSAILDEEVCSPCAKEDGKKFKLNSAAHLAHETPYAKCKGKDNCRCVLIAQWKGK